MACVQPRRCQVIILGLCIVCAYLIKEYRFYYLPESGAAMLVGLIVGVWCVLAANWRNSSSGTVTTYRFSPTGGDCAPDAARVCSFRVGRRWSSCGSMCVGRCVRALLSEAVVVSSVVAVDGKPRLDLTVLACLRRRNCCSTSCCSRRSSSKLGTRCIGYVFVDRPSATRTLQRRAEYDGYVCGSRVAACCTGTPLMHCRNDSSTTSSASPFLIEQLGSRFVKQLTLACCTCHSQQHDYAVRGARDDGVNIHHRVPDVLRRTGALQGSHFIRFRDTVAFGVYYTLSMLVVISVVCSWAGSRSTLPHLWRRCCSAHSSRRSTPSRHFRFSATRS